MRRVFSNIFIRNIFLHRQFKSLAHNLKRSLVSRSVICCRPPREPLFQNNHQLESINTFLTDPLSNHPEPTSKKKLPPVIIQPKRCNPISKFLPIRPVYGAYKYYDSNATHEIKQEEKELMMEICNYPQLEHEYRVFAQMKKVDPYFHIGGFPREVLLRSPDENVYNHVQSSGISSTSYSNNMSDPYNYYNNDDECNSIKDESYFQENEFLNDHADLDKDNYLFNQYQNEGSNNSVIQNNRRVISTR